MSWANTDLWLLSEIIPELIVTGDNSEFIQKQYEIVMTWWILSEISINLRQMDHDWGDDLAQRYLIKSDRVGATAALLLRRFHGHSYSISVDMCKKWVN